MFKRKLFKRALPIILSVAMIFQSAPATALAAEDPAVVETADVTDTEGESEAAESTTDEPAEPASEPESGSSAASGVSDGQTADSSETEGQGTSVDNAEEESDAQTGSTEIEESGVSESSTETEITDEGQDNKTFNEGEDTAVPSLDTKLVFEDMNKDVAGFTPVIGETDPTFYTTYGEGKCGALQTELKNWITVSVDDEVLNDDIKENFKFQWESVTRSEGADTVYAPLQTLPVDAGEYRLTITLDAVENLCKQAEAYVFVRIDQKEITFNLDDEVLQIKPGETVDTFKKQIEEGYQLLDGEESPVDRAIITQPLVLSVFQVEKGAKGTALEPTETFSAKGDYIVTVDELTLDAALTANYRVVTEDSYQIKVGELQKTEVIVNLKDPGKDIIKVYDGQAASEDLIEVVEIATGEEQTKKDIRVIVAGDETETAIEGATATLGWYTRKLDTAAVGSGYTYTKLDEAPKDAGEYYVIWTYDGDEDNAYAKSESAPVRVTIDPAPVVITIDSEKLPKFSVGMTAEEAAKALIESEFYAVKALNESVNDKGETIIEIGEDVKDASDPDFFGVSYAGDDETGKTQYYKPEFKLQRRISARKDGDGNKTELKEEEKKETDWKGISGELVIETDAYVYEYRVILTGKKVIVGERGQIISEDITETSTNSANSNYLVQTDADTLAQNAVPVVLNDAARTVINTDAIVAEFTKNYASNTGKGAIEDPAVKILDLEALFTDRAAYKKAVVLKAEDNTETGKKDTDKSLTYSWYYMQLSEYEKKYAAYSKLTDDQAKAAFDWGSFSSLETYTDADNGEMDSTIGASVYRLTITFNDADHAYQSSSANVYFKVEQREVVVEPDGQTARIGQNISEWKEQYNDDVNELNRYYYSVYQLPNNSEEEFNSITDAAAKEALRIEIRPSAWIVERQKKDQTGNPIDEYEEVVGTEAVFEEGYQYYVSALITDNLYFTSKDKAKSTESEDVYHICREEIVFTGDIALTIDVNADALKALSRQYDGTSVFKDGLPEGFIKIYADAAKTQDVTAELLSLTDDDPGKVHVLWQRDEDEKYLYYTPGVVWGGTYRLVLEFRGTSVYKPLGLDTEGNIAYGAVIYSDCELNVTPRNISITPKTKTASKAGEYAGELIADGLTVEGDIVDKDKKFFEYAALSSGWFNEAGTHDADDDYDYEIDKHGGYPAFGGAVHYSIQIDDKSEIKEPWDEYLRFGSTYTVKLTYNGLVSPLAESYNVTYKPAKVTDVQRGEGRVQATSFLKVYNKDNGYTDLRYTYANNTYSIDPREAVRFYYDSDYSTLYDYNDDPISLNRNMIAYRIYAPKEFEGDTSGSRFDANKKNFIYKNAVKAAGGYILEDWTVDSDDSHYLTVLFPVTDTDKEKAFAITWEHDYTDTFKLVNAQLEADLTKAVAPKALAFNGVSAKMAVGETQQLDVKITKAQLGDIVNIRYRIQGSDKNSNDYISINPETGLVTALREGKQATTIEAYPVRRGADGTFEEITGKGVKIAKTKITVTAVSAPAIKKIVTADYNAQVQYTQVADGYRREIYVIETTKAEAKKLKKEQFETKIADMKNGQWDEAGFAMAPKYIYSDNYDQKLKLCVAALPRLKADKTYVVYVRNVSAARTLDDGSKVDLSYNGTVKNFVTTKSQVIDLELEFDAVNGSDKVDKTHPVYWQYDENWNGHYYVDLFSKSAQVMVNGLFAEYEDGNAAAESGDQRRYALAPKADLPKISYLTPKLTYGVFDSAEYDDDVDPWTAKASASKYATINNKGKLTLKGVGLDGSARVYVWVKADNGETDCVELNIITKVTDLTGKKAKLKVGDTIRLADYLDYKNEKKKVPSYYSGRISITNEMIAKAVEAGYDIWDAYDWEGQRTDWYITAVSPNKTPFKLEISDQMSDGTVKTAAVTLTSAQLDPVKALKVTYVDDKNITLNFTHAGSPQAFAIEVADARGSIIEKRLVYRWDAEQMYTTDDKLVKAEQQWIQYLFGNDNNFKYYRKNKTYAYTINSNKLVRLSAYTISVTPVYGNESAAKKATVKTKTTNIPAARDENIEVIGGQGTEIYVSNRNNYTGWISLSNNPYLVSGNTYTLGANDCDGDARDRITDTLTWKSSNTKVASIKANPGSYTATLKAAQQGITDITVTSKITKKVIAKYTVRVKAVGNGAPAYGGEYELSWDNGFYQNILAKWDPYYEGRMEVLTLSNSVTISDSTRYDRTWVSFTAPHFGEYIFSKDEIFVCDENGNEMQNYTGTMILPAGQKIYFRLAGNDTLSVTGNEFARLTVANDSENAFVAKSGQYVTFTAPEDNYYTFTGSINRVLKDSGSELTELLSYYEDSYEVGLKAGETLFIKAYNGTTLSVSYNKADKTYAFGDSAPAAIELTAAQTEQIVRFTAPRTAQYTFTATLDNEVEVAYYSATGNVQLTNGGAVRADEMTAKAVRAADTQKTDEKTFTIDAGQTIIIKFTTSFDFGDLEDEKNENKDKKFTASVTVAAPEIKILNDGESGSVTKGTTAVFSFKVLDGKYVVTTDKCDGVAYYDRNFNELELGDSFVVGSGNDLKAGDTIYIEAQSSDDKNDGTIIVNKVVVKPISGETEPLEIQNGGEYWYTYTAKAAGTYEFDVTATPNKDQAGNETDSHANVRLVYYDEPFGSETTLNSDMKVGNKVTFQVLYDNAAEDKTKTSATLSVKNVTAAVTPVKGDTPVTLAAAGDVKYYSFTAPDDDTYAFEWVQTDAKGKANIGIGDSVNGAFSSVSSVSVELSAGDVKYIKVTAEDKDAAGTLKISALKAAVTELKSGKEGQFDLKKSGDQAVFKFTVPQDAEFGWEIVTTVTGKKEGENDPVVYIEYTNGDSKKLSLYDMFGSEKAGLVTITVTADGNASAGSIVIKPVEVKTLTADETVKVTATAPKYFKFVVPESARWGFPAVVAANNDAWMDVLVGDDAELVQGVYAVKGTTIYIVAGTDKTTEQSITVKSPAMIGPVPLSADNPKVKIEAGSINFYEFKAPDYARYTFAAPEKVEMELYKGTSNIASESDTMTLEKDETVFIVMYADEEVSFDYAITKTAMNVLTAGTESAEITLEKGQSATFEVPCYESGRYVFKTTNATKDAKLDVEGFEVYDNEGNSVDVFRTEYMASEYDGFYIVKNCSKFNTKAEFTVTNNGEAQAKFKVLVSKADSKEIAVSKEETIDVNKNEREWITFKIAEKGRYNITAGNDNVAFMNGSSPVSFEEDRLLTAGTYTYSLATTGDAAKETAKVKITLVTATPINADTDITTTKANEVHWYEITAGQDATYTFASKGDNALSSIQVYTDMNSTSYSSGNSYYLEKGEKKYIRVTTGTAAGKYTLGVTIKVPLLNKTLNFMTYEQQETLTFTAPEDGDYVITGTADGVGGDFYVEYVYPSEMEDAEKRVNVWDDNNLGTLTVSGVKANEIVTIKVYTYDFEEEGTTGQYNQWIKIQVEKAE